MFSLEDMPVAAYEDDIFRNSDNALKLYGNKLFNSAQRFVVVVPEYNGSIPGVFKLLIDACDPEIFFGKKFALVGVASGRAGNLRGLDHLTDILHYLRAEVFSLKQPISQIRRLAKQDEAFNDQETLIVLQRHINGFAAF